MPLAPFIVKEMAFVSVVFICLQHKFMGHYAEVKVKGIKLQSFMY